MSDPCKRCGDPEESHDGPERGQAIERNCNLYRIGTQLQNLNFTMEKIASALEGLERR